MAIEKLNFSGAGQSSNSSSSNNASGYSSIADRFLQFGDQLNKDQIIRDRDAYAKERDLISDKRYDEQQAILKAERDKKANTEKALLDFQNQMSNYETSGIVDANKGLGLSQEYDNLKASGKSDIEASNIIQNRINAIEQQDKKMLDESPIARYDRINSLKISGDGIDPTMLITLKNQRLKELMDAEDKKQDRAFDEKKFNQDVAESKRNYDLQMKQFNYTKNKDLENDIKEATIEASKNLVGGNPSGKKIEETKYEEYFTPESQNIINEKMYKTVSSDKEINNIANDIERLEGSLTKNYTSVDAEKDFNEINKSTNFLNKKNNIKNIEDKIKSLESQGYNTIDGLGGDAKIELSDKEKNEIDLLKFELDKLKAKNPKDFYDAVQKKDEKINEDIASYSKKIEDRIKSYEQKAEYGVKKDKKIVGTGKFSYQYDEPSVYASKVSEEQIKKAKEAGVLNDVQIQALKQKSYNAAFNAQADAIKTKKAEESAVIEKAYSKASDKQKSDIDILNKNVENAARVVKALKDSDEADDSQIEEANAALQDAYSKLNSYTNSIL